MADGMNPDESRLHRLRSALAEGPLPSERLLAERLGVTRHALRNDLATLRGRGELPAVAPRPSTARSLQAASLRLAEHTNPPELLEVRLALEPALARLAALRATPADIARIRAACVTPTGADITATDMAFHGAVAAGSRNGLAAALYGLLRRIAQSERARGPQSLRDAFTGKRVPARDAEHEAVAEAIAARDPDAAEAAMRNHLQSVGRTMMLQMTGGAPAR